VLFERQAPLQQLGDDYQRATTVGGRIVLVSGEAGIGKTSLIAEFAGSLPDNTTVCWGGCEALFAARPLGPVFDIAEQLGGPLLELLRSDSEGHKVYSEFLAILESSGHRGSVFIFEDIHWADNATMDFLKYVGRRIMRSHCLILATYRDDEIGANHPLNYVIGDLPASATSRIRLAPLSVEAIAALAEVDNRRARQILKITGGNPFFVQELSSSSDRSVPQSVSDAILAKASRLTGDARRLLNLVSVVPGRCELPLLLSAFPNALELVDQCAEHGLLTADPNFVSFRHELARLAVEDSLPAGQRRRWNAHLLTELRERMPHALARLSHHADNCGDRDAVLEYAPRAAQESARLGAHREAVTLYRQALSHADASSEQARADLLEKLAYELYVTGRIDDAIDARRQSLALWSKAGDELHQAMALRWLSRLHWFVGKRDEADRYAEQALEASRPLADRREYAMACSNRAQLYMLSSESEQAMEWARKAIEIATQNEDEETLAHALNNLGAAMGQSSLDEGLDHLRTSLEISRRNDLQEHVARAYTNLASNTVIAKRYAEATRYLEAGIQYTTDRDLDSWLYYMLGWRARLRLETGDWDGAAGDAMAVLQNYRGSTLVASPAMTVLAQLHLRRGDPDFDAAFDSAHAAVAHTREVQRLAALQAIRAEQAWLAGSEPEAGAELRETRDWAMRLNQLWAAGELSWWLRKLGLEDAPPAIDLPGPYDLLLGKGDWAGAARAWQTLGCPYEAALALAEGDAAAQKTALDRFTRLGAEPAAAKLRKNLRAQGVRDLPVKARRSTRENPAGLTNRQLAVLRALAAGLSDGEIAARLFISPRTVGHHVSAILGKLGVQSRTEAAVAAAKLGIGDKK